MKDGNRDMKTLSVEPTCLSQNCSPELHLSERCSALREVTVIHKVRLLIRLVCSI